VKQELYGPLWIAVTLIIEFCILSHMIGALKLQSIISNSGDDSQSYYKNEDLLEKFANQSVARLFKVTFLIILMFLVNPFIAYLVFKNRGAIEVTFTHLLQIYGYSLAIFVPLGFIHCIFYPLLRLRFLLTIGAGCISLYYVFKETREYVVKYLEGQDESTLRYMKMYTVGSTVVFGMLFRYYFLGA
jgi:Yip1 domain